jgi:hypothetical protein
MNDVSVFGAVVSVMSSATFPAGFNVTQFADDADPFDIPKITITDKAMGANGDLITWSKATPIDITIAVINGSADDVNLATLLEANRTGRGKLGARDIITVTAVYADGRTITLSNGKIAGGMPGESMASAGRLKSKSYDFFFENMVRTGGL